MKKNEINPDLLAFEEAYKRFPEFEKEYIEYLNLRMFTKNYILNADFYSSLVYKFKNNSFCCGGYVTVCDLANYDTGITQKKEYIKAYEELNRAFESGYVRALIDTDLYQVTGKLKVKKIVLLDKKHIEFVFSGNFKIKDIIQKKPEQKPEYGSDFMNSYIRNNAKDDSSSDLHNYIKNNFGGFNPLER